MKPVAIGTRASLFDRNGARAYGRGLRQCRRAGGGNAGPEIGFLETAADRCLRPVYEPKEGSVGTVVEIVHLAPAPKNATIEARAELIAIDGRRHRFAVAAFHGDTPLMKGIHERVVVDLERFLARLTAPAEG